MEPRRVTIPLTLPRLRGELVQRHRWHYRGSHRRRTHRRGNHRRGSRRMGCQRMGCRRTGCRRRGRHPRRTHLRGSRRLKGHERRNRHERSGSALVEQTLYLVGGHRVIDDTDTSSSSGCPSSLPRSGTHSLLDGRRRYDGVGGAVYLEVLTDGVHLTAAVLDEVAFPLKDRLAVSN